MPANTGLHQAKAAKKDEFYTQMVDIENELRHYRKHFKGKVVYCNCDDPRVSNFSRYFSQNFEKLGLKRLITTCYKSQQTEIFSQNDSEKAIYQVYEGESSDSKISAPPILRGSRGASTHLLKGDGDFRSEECIELLEQSDIVVTNPPFSLFREYVAQLAEHKKQFLILGDQNAITYKEIFKLIKDNQMWLGFNNGGTKWFEVQDHYDIKTASRKKVVDGKKYFSMGRINWYTNLDHQKRHEELLLYSTYKGNESKYPSYDNYDAIEVKAYKIIPLDYQGAMGVPITFLDKYNPEQFEIVGSDYEVKQGLLPHLVSSGWEGKLDRGYIDGKRSYARLLIKHRKPKS